MSSLLVSRSVIVAASPQEVFDLLADPSQHHTIDGSGTVKGNVVGGPARLSVGAKFGMSMKLGVPYRITNTVVDFVEGKSIAWRHIGKHTWRYDLEPVEGDTSTGSPTGPSIGPSTRVTETFDGTSSIFPFALSLTGAGKRNAVAIEATLARLQQRFAKPIRA
jgi:Polyketide cyclase / dehydrase and lipid transport